MKKKIISDIIEFQEQGQTDTRSIREAITLPPNSQNS